MWLPDDETNFLDGCSNEQKTESNAFQRSTSPPLEGGESLCEFYIESSKTCEKSKSPGLSRNAIDKQDNASSFHYSGSGSYPGKNEVYVPTRSFTSILNKDLLAEISFTQAFLKSILSSVDSPDPVVANAYTETLLDVIDFLPKEIVKEEILTLAVNKGQMSQPVSSRLLCCKILGKICLKFDPYIIKMEVLPVVLSLCQDVEFEVRGSVCKQLGIISKGVGLEATKSSILPELVELAKDEEAYVRLASIETVVQMLPTLDNDTCTQAIIPLLQKLCESSMSKKDFMLPVLARQFGRICCGLADILSPEMHQWFLEFFKKLAKLGLPDNDNIASSMYNPMPDLLTEVDNQDRFRECRCACAYNFPAMVLFNGPENFMTDLFSTMQNLCADSCQDVRQTIASGFYEVAKLLNSKASLLLPELVTLLKDNSLDVLKGVIPYLPDCLKMVCSSVSIEDNEQKDLVEALLACEEVTSVTSSWRIYADFLTCLSCLTACVSSETIFETFVPLLFIKLHTARPIPCRTAAAYSLLIFLRHTPCLDRRKGIINELIRELCYGRSCHKRMLFIRVCELVLELFSKVFFKLHFFRPLLSLSSDPVPNVRLRLCSVLPRLKSVIKLPKDSNLLQQLESCVKTLISDQRDRDVAHAVSQAIEQLDRIEVAEEPASRRSSCIELALDIQDQLKEKEEKHQLEMEFNSKLVPENSHLPILVNSIAKGGKIPVRKSGTLPKQAKEKEQAELENPVIRRFSSQPKSIRLLKKERRISSPALSVEYRKTSSPSIIPAKETAQTQIPLKSPLSKCNIPQSRPQSPNIRTWPRQKRLSLIPTTSNDRCPSPMPSRPRQLADQNSAKPSSESAKDDKTKVPKLTKENFAKKGEEKVRGTIMPSPELLRRSVTLMNLNSDSKIPTSSPKRSIRENLLKK